MPESGIRGRPVAVIDAPSNLGLRPAEDGVSPGVYKLAGALRDTGLLDGLCAFDGGVVVAPRYSAIWQPGDGVRNGRAIERYSSKLAGRIECLLDGGFFPVVLGGDCSVLIGNQLALRRRGRFGLAFIDGHSDFRHPGNSEFVGSAAGEDLAIVTGRGDPLASIEGRAPLVRAEDVVVLGVRDHDLFLDEVQAAGIRVATAGDIARAGPASVAAQALARLRSPELAGFWIHCDFDVLDSSVMPAVDTPEPAGIDFDALVELLAPLLADEGAVGVEFTIFDPDLDEDSALAAKITESLCRAFASATALVGRTDRASQRIETRLAATASCGGGLTRYATSTPMTRQARQPKGRCDDRSPLAWLDGA
jgi:arginase